MGRFYYQKPSLLIDSLPDYLHLFAAKYTCAAFGFTFFTRSRETGARHKICELIALAVAVTTRCESCIGVHADEAVKAGATEEEVAAALAMSIALNAGAAYTYSLRALEAYNAQKGE